MIEPRDSSSTYSSLISSAADSNRRRYFDHAATSFPKPDVVTQAMVEYATTIGASAGRGAYAEARASGKVIDDCRQAICDLIHGESSRHVIFTLNASDALNLALRGLITHAADEPGGHVITTWMEHNSVLRPLNALVQQGMIEQTRVAADERTGIVNPLDIRQAIRPDTRLIAVIHGSNVTGTIQPIAEIGEICRQFNIPFVVDAAQTAGHVPIDVQAMHIDCLAIPGHKALLGPLGTGALYIRPGLEHCMSTIREGGTGSVSELDTQPDFLPDRFEPGSHNAIGIAGLLAGLQWIRLKGIDSIRSHEENLMRTMIEVLDKHQPKNLQWLGPRDIAHRCGVFSFSVDGVPPNTFAELLESKYGLLARSGLHCAPLVHKTLGTFDQGGTTRMSFGVFTTQEDVRFAAHAVCDAAQSLMNATPSEIAANHAIVTPTV